MNTAERIADQLLDAMGDESCWVPLQAEAAAELRRLAAVEQELEEARKDAERYRLPVKRFAQIIRNQALEDAASFVEPAKSLEDADIRGGTAGAELLRDMATCIRSMKEKT